MKLQKDKFNRIRDAYINQIFTLDEYNNERKKVEELVNNLEKRLEETEVCEKLKFTPEDILVKRDIDFINSIKYPEKYKQYNKSWKEYSREEKADLIMKYVDEVELLEKKVYSRDTEIARLKNQLVSKNEEIDELEEKVDKLQEIVDTFKELWRKFLMFLQNKFFSNDKKYENFIEDLYYKDILDKNDIDIIQNNRFIKNKDTDDFER